MFSEMIEVFTTLLFVWVLPDVTIGEGATTSDTTLPFEGYFSFINVSYTLLYKNHHQLFSL